MIRATLLLAAVGLAGVAAVWWTARNLDPLRVLEQITPAQVRTVDLSGSGAFPRTRSEQPREEDPGPEAAPAPVRPEPVAAPGPAPSPEREEPGLPEEPVEEIVVATAALKPSLELREGPAAPESPPVDPDSSAELIRRMLSLYPRRGESE